MLNDVKFAISSIYEPDLNVRCEIDFFCSVFQQQIKNISNQTGFFCDLVKYRVLSVDGDWIQFFREIMEKGIYIFRGPPPHQETTYLLWLVFLSSIIHRILVCQENVYHITQQQDISVVPKRRRREDGVMGFQNPSAGHQCCPTVAGMSARRCTLKTQRQAISFLPQQLGSENLVLCGIHRSRLCLTQVKCVDLLFVMSEYRDIV